MVRDENQGPLGIIPGAYHGCDGVQADTAALMRRLRSPLLRGALWMQTPPLEHPKLHLVPLGPSRAALAALRRAPPAPPPLDAQRRVLYYVNHSPTPTREATLSAVQSNFNGSLHNRFCAHPARGKTDCPDRRSRVCEKHYSGVPFCKLSPDEYVAGLHGAAFVASPPGMGEDCFRHYEAMLAGAVPVVRRSLSYAVLKGLQHLPTDSWSHVTPRWLREQQRAAVSAPARTAGRSDASLERLTRGFWTRLVDGLRYGNGTAATYRS